MSVPVIPGCTVQTYGISPGASTVAVKVLPLPNSSDSNSPPSATALCSIVSSLTQHTCWPTLAVASFGSNLMSAILISRAPLGQASEDAPSSPPPPSSPPQAASATINTRGSRRRMEAGIQSSERHGHRRMVRQAPAVEPLALARGGTAVAEKVVDVVAAEVHETGERGRALEVDVAAEDQR